MLDILTIIKQSISSFVPQITRFYYLLNMAVEYGFELRLGQTKTYDMLYLMLLC